MWFLHYSFFVELEAYSLGGNRRNEERMLGLIIISSSDSFS